jgi:hypothetical protein
VFLFSPLLASEASSKEVFGSSHKAQRSQKGKSFNLLLFRAFRVFRGKNRFCVLLPSRIMLKRDCAVTAWHPLCEVPVQFPKSVLRIRPEPLLISLPSISIQ